MNLRTHSAVTRTQGANIALKDGTVQPATFIFAFEEVPVLIKAFRRMVRGLEFDICELAMTTYLCSRAFDKQFTALPIFLTRGFHHGALLVNTQSGIRSPKDLEGRRVGVNRGWTVTTGVWVRGILAHEYGVDLDRITWVLSGDEHVAEYRPPANVVPDNSGRSMAEQLISGELPAAIGVDVDHPDVQPLIPDAFEAGLNALRSRGDYPVNHAVVVRNDVLAAHPEIAVDIFNAFARAKQLYVQRLRDGNVENPTEADRLNLAVMNVLPDPLPYGIEPNRFAIETLVDMAVEQQIIPRRISADDLFVPSTHGLIG